MSYVRYIIRRLVLALVVLVCVSILTFVIARVIPSDPAELYAGQRPTQAQVAQARQHLGLDRPLHEQYLAFASGILRGDFGRSLRTRNPIIQDMRAFFPATLELMVSSTLIALVIGIPIGALVGAHPGGYFDQVIRVLAIAIASLPSFWMALMLQLVFFRMLNWLPLAGRTSKEITVFYPIQTISGFHLIDAALTANWVGWRDAALHLVLPSLTLALYPLGLAVRMMRNAVLEVMNEKYIVAARAQGIDERTILFRFALKNAITPTLTVLGLSFVHALTGAVLVEIVFSWSGLGRYIADAILNVDFPVIIVITLLVTACYVLMNLVIDLVQALLDPRVVLR